MNKLRLDEQSDFGVYVNVVELEPLEGMRNGPVYIRTASNEGSELSGPTVVLSNEQVVKLRDWLNEFLSRTT